MVTNNDYFYEIRYAYPSSEMAKQLNRRASGCYYVILDKKIINEPFELLSEAIDFARSTGYMPSFYSVDVYKGA